MIKKYRNLKKFTIFAVTKQLIFATTPYTII